jgi:hypothetical protein
LPRYTFYVVETDHPSEELPMGEIRRESFLGKKQALARMREIMREETSFVGYESTVRVLRYVTADLTPLRLVMAISSRRGWYIERQVIDGDSLRPHPDDEDQR